MPMISSGVRCVIVFILAVLSTPFRAHGEVETLLAELNRKPAEERLTILTEGARKERVLSFYGSAPVSNSQDVIRAFNKHYPFIEVRYTRLGAPSLVSRLSTEYQAGSNNADLISIRGTLFPELIDKKIIAKYTSPMASVMRSGLRIKKDTSRVFTQPVTRSYTTPATSRSLKSHALSRICCMLDGRGDW